MGTQASSLQMLLALLQSFALAFARQKSVGQGARLGTAGRVEAAVPKLKRTVHICLRRPSDPSHSTRTIQSLAGARSGSLQEPLIDLIEYYSGASAERCSIRSFLTTPVPPGHSRPLENKGGPPPINTLTSPLLCVRGSACVRASMYRAARGRRMSTFRIQLPQSLLVSPSPP